MSPEDIQIHKSHSSVDKKYLKLIEIGENEVVICAIKKHPIGLISIYLSGFLVSLIVVIAIVLVGVWLEPQLSGVSFPISTVFITVGVFMGVVSFFLTYVAGFVYQNNILILTNEKVAQILYKNLIDRKISQLSLGELQDITVDQKGLLARAFQYGTIVLETAGEQNNYNFTYTRYPQHCAKELVLAHESSIKRYGN